MKFDTKIAVVLREDLAVWQKLNVTAFAISGITAAVPGVTGEAYEDASGNRYLPMLVQPVMVFSATADDLHAVFERAMAMGAKLAIYTDELFATGFDAANRTAVKAVAQADLKLAGLALREDKKVADKILKGLKLHP